MDRAKLRERIRLLGGIPIPVKGEHTFFFGRRNYEWFLADFPELDVNLEVAKLVAWAKRNPDKQVERKAVFGLITSWLKRADQDRKRRAWIQRAENEQNTAETRHDPEPRR